MQERKSVYIAWQAPETREWHIVGKLSERDDKYVFNYTKGALVPKSFIPFSGMNDLNNTYVSNELFPLFGNRLLSPKRPEYPQFIKWLGLAEKEASPVAILGRSGGMRGTDSLQLFNRLEFRENGSFDYYFFAHGISHLCECSSKRVSSLKKGDELYLCLDCQNEYHESAILIRTSRPKQFAGYCPRYIADDINHMLKEDAMSVRLYVESLQEDAPSNYRLLCKLTGSCSTEMQYLMGSDEFETVPVVDVKKYLQQ